MVRLTIYSLLFFFFNDTATTEIYTLSLHDALPIFERRPGLGHGRSHAPRLAGDADEPAAERRRHPEGVRRRARSRSEEHTSELQSRQYLVCRLLLEKKKIHTTIRLVHLHDTFSTVP